MTPDEKLAQTLHDVLCSATHSYDYSHSSKLAYETKAQRLLKVMQQDYQACYNVIYAIWPNVAPTQLHDKGTPI